ncbi:PTS sugar transporter subunit IIA [Sedimentisphaera salicampi]|uniref:EIIABC-Fru n=1 Tax=Sedimentisphaera salicampi TaxID=1941349 RepID=A0A1W6LQ99_9BACT|nr:PTS sugar transporter subunit IIA [Sedimentisphaera salicampi]ARN57936.1 EIIABC-Fru [Sedimentisphaera salicampi]OXU14104.1 EIIABC-Fru [Sedimentisphaera salicampi]
MLISQILKKSSIIVPLKSAEKDDVIEELIDKLNENGLLTDRDDVLDKVMTREMTRSTGIGQGIAIPHGKSKGVNELIMAMGIASSEIDFDSIDNKPVSIVILLVSPAGQTGPHIQALAKISRLMLDGDFRQKLQDAQDAEEVYNLLSSKESE